MKISFSDAKKSIKRFINKTEDKIKNSTLLNDTGKKLLDKIKLIKKDLFSFIVRYRFAISCTVVGLIFAAIIGICISSGVKKGDSSTYANNTTPTPYATKFTGIVAGVMDDIYQEQLTDAPTSTTDGNGEWELEIDKFVTVPPVVETEEPDVVLRSEHNEIITDVQLKLMELWYMDKDEPTDYFGSITEGALRAFQRRNDLDINGRLTQQTYDLLMSGSAKIYMTALGDEGDDVVVVQQRLYELGYLESYYKTKGVFDESTEEAVKEFQEANKLSVDGMVGRNTKEALYSPDAKGKGFELGDQDPEIEKYQSRLQELGYLTTEPDGIFGKDTQIAVKRFQSQNDLIEDGFLGPVTREKLMSSDAVGNALQYGMEGSDVRNVQQRLYELNYLRAKNVNGYFTAITEKAVKLFQKNCGVQQDGKVGRNTMNLLFSDDAPRASSPVSSGGSSGGGNNGGGSGGGNSGGNDDSDVTNRIDNFIRIANNKLGSKYVRGGKGPNVFDCSGFVYWCLNKAGVKQSYMTSYMWRSCTKYQRNNSFNNIKRGDVIVYDGHVAIAIGNGMMIDASQSKGKVVKRSYQTSYWKSVFICSYRIFR